MKRFLGLLLLGLLPVVSFGNSYQSLLIEALEAKNQQLPKWLSSTIRIESIRLSGKNIVSYYTVQSPAATNKEAEFQLKEKMLASTCQTDDLQVPLRLGYQFRHLVFDDKGKQLFNIVINRYDCIRAYKDYKPKPVWFEIGQTESATFYVDIRSIDKVHHQSYIHLKTEYRNDPKYKTTISEVAFQCQDNTYRIKNVQFFNAKGELEKNDNPLLTWKKVTHLNTPIDLAYRFTCEMTKE